MITDVILGRADRVPDKQEKLTGEDFEALLLK